ncbi:MAG: imidazole glycerol phosphate synthase subunit HisH [Phycisphaerae bacterium]|jgi:glutamine amidotransferase
MIGIVDCGVGNLRSVQKALEQAGADAQLVTTPSQLEQASKIVVPGVAAFGDTMDLLGRKGLVEPLVRAVREGVPYLGFCLGLQLLFDISYEDGQHTGLGLLPGKVVRFRFDTGVTGQRLSVPHMGWNQIRWDRDIPLLDGVDSGAYVYFAHSYHVVPADMNVVAATTDYGYEFVSAVWKDNIFATQFHPEKSQAVGLRLLKNFVDL